MEKLELVAMSPDANKVREQARRSMKAYKCNRPKVSLSVTESILTVILVTSRYKNQLLSLCYIVNAGV